MPPKALFDGSYRPDKLVMPSCDACNSGTSTADLTAAIISRWEYAATDVQNADHRRLAARLRKQSPEIVEEWTKDAGPSLNRKGRIHLRSFGVPVPDDASIVTIGPRTIRQLNLFAHKATLALYFEHFRQPLPVSGAYCAFWKTKEDFGQQGIPQSLLEMLPQYGTLIQGRWDESQTFEYRHAVNAEGGFFGFFARLRRGLFISGFAVADVALLPEPDDEWLKPGNLLSLLENPRFERKL